MPDLTGNSALDVAIGLAFVYLLFSILCSAVQEAIAGFFDLRAATLEKGLRSLLEDPGVEAQGGAPTAVGVAPPAVTGEAPAEAVGSTGPANITDELLGHGLIRGLYQDSRVLFRRRRRGPSYLPPDMFALALLNVIAPKSYADPLADVRQGITEATLPAGTKNALLTLANGVAKDRDHLRKLIEDWFDGAMGRVSGWYKRKTQIIICALALLVAVGLNVNTVAIADRLTRDDAVRAAVVDQATKFAQPSNDPKAQKSDLKAAADRITEVDKLGLPFGWNKKEGDPARPGFDGRTLLGWLLTFIALSLGAPFWFDTLSKLARLRNTGPPEKPHEIAPTREPEPARVAITLEQPGGGGAGF
jgi:hypothetical protein